MTRLRFLLGLLGIPMAAQKVSPGPTHGTISTAEKYDFGKGKQLKPKPNGQCPVCGTMSEKISAKVLLEQARAIITCYPHSQGNIALTDCRQATLEDMPKTFRVECKNRNCRVMFGMDVTE